MSLERAKWAAVAAATVLAFTAFLGDAHAQAINVKEFSCASTDSVNVDVAGLGTTNICVTSVATVDLACACVNNSGSCPQAANKAITPTTISSATTLQVKNGRVNTTVSLPISVNNASCTEPSGCGAGQTVKLIEFTTEDSEPTFTLCTTTAAVGQPCTCEGATPLATPQSCGPTSATTFPGKSNSCLALFQ